MKYSKVIKTIFFALPILLVSCSEDLADGYKINKNLLKTGNSTLNFSDDVTSSSLTIESKDSWNITKYPEWLEISPTSGKGKTEISVNVIEYPTSDEGRTDTIFFKLDNLTTKVVVKQAPSAYKFIVSALTLEFGSTETFAKSIDLDNNTKWSARTTKGWCSVYPSSGKGSGKISVTCQENTTKTERTDTLYISSSRETKKVVIVQSGSKYYLKTSPVKLDKFTKFGGSQTLNILSNTDWTIISSDGWCSLSSNRGNGDKEILVNASQNTLTTERNATITLSWADEEMNIVVLQERGEDPRLTFTPQAIGQVSNQGGIYTFNVSSNVQWSVESNQEWCSIDSPDGPILGDGSFTINIGNNPIGGAARYAIISIMSSAGDKTVEIRQAAGESPYINFVPNSLETSPIEYENVGGTQTFTVQSNIEWSIESSDNTWCHIESPSCAITGNGEVKIKVDVNPAEAPERTSTLRIKSSWFEDKIVTVHQKKGDPGYVRVSNSTLNAKPQGETLSFNIESNLSNWTVSSNQSWCDVKTTSGSFNGTVSLSVGLNSDTTTRDATITIKSAISDVTVTVHQEPKAVPGGNDNPNPRYSRKR